MKIVMGSGVAEDEAMTAKEREDYMRELSLNMANGYAATIGGLPPSEVIGRATAYLSFLEGATVGCLQ